MITTFICEIPVLPMLVTNFVGFGSDCCQWPKVVRMIGFKCSWHDRDQICDHATFGHDHAILSGSCQNPQDHASFAHDHATFGRDHARMLTLCQRS